jgi:hypothetical protein
LGEYFIVFLIRDEEEFEGGGDVVLGFIFFAALVEVVQWDQSPTGGQTMLKVNE